MMSKLYIHRHTEWIGQTFWLERQRFQGQGQMFDGHLWIFWRILNKCMKCQMNYFEDTDVNKRMLQRYYTGSFKMNVKSNGFMTETYLTFLFISNYIYNYSNYGRCNFLARMWQIWYLLWYIANLCILFWSENDERFSEMCHWIIMYKLFWSA